MITKPSLPSHPLTPAQVLEVWCAQVESLSSMPDPEFSNTAVDELPVIPAQLATRSISVHFYDS